MSTPDELEGVTELSTEPADLKPKKPSNRAPQGIRTFTVCRQHDESGVSGEGVVIEGATFATGHTVIHWLTPAHVAQSLSSMHSMIFLKYISNPTQQQTIITFEDGEQLFMMEAKNGI